MSDSPALFRVQVEALGEFCIDVLVWAGVQPSAARAVSAALVFAEERGVRSHGVGLLASYVRNLEQGGAKALPEIVVLRQGAAFAVVDADNGLGPVGAAFATQLAIEKARSAGVATVTVRNSNHFGAAAYYACLGAKAGMIAEIFSNAPPMMAPTGGRERVLGNNPQAMAVPMGDGLPMVIDIAMSKVAGGRIINAAAAGLPIPEGWLLDPVGGASCDPNDYHRGGALVAFGEHKGYGLALGVEAMAGALAGANIATDVQSFRRTPDRPSGTGHTIRMTHVESFLPLDDFYARMETLRTTMKQSARVAGVDEILLPGERGARAAEGSRQDGVAVSAEAWSDVLKLAAQFGIKPPASDG